MAYVRSPAICDLASRKAADASFSLTASREATVHGPCTTDSKLRSTPRGYIIDIDSAIVDVVDLNRDGAFHTRVSDLIDLTERPVRPVSAGTA